jgi:hypothetical protein
MREISMTKETLTEETSSSSMKRNFTAIAGAATLAAVALFFPVKLPDGSTTNALKMASEAHRNSFSECEQMHKESAAKLPLCPYVLSFGKAMFAAGILRLKPYRPQ